MRVYNFIKTYGVSRKPNYNENTCNFVITVLSNVDARFTSESIEVYTK